MNALLIFRTLSPGKEVLIREENIYIYHLSGYKISADSERKIVDLLCPIAQKIEGKGRARCRADPRPAHSLSQMYIQGDQHVSLCLGRAPREPSWGDPESFLGREQTGACERVRDLWGPFIWAFSCLGSARQPMT